MLNSKRKDHLVFSVTYMVVKGVVQRFAYLKVPVTSGLQSSTRSAWSRFVQKTPMVDYWSPTRSIKVTFLEPQALAATLLAL